MTTIILHVMGGNGSYIPSEGGVPAYKRTHDELDRRIDGHKILVQKKSPQQVQVPMNSNSENPLYLCGRINKNTKAVEIVAVGIYKGHKLVKSIDLVYDSNGKLIPYHPDRKSSHSHDWKRDEFGKIGRKSGQQSNHLPIDPRYMSLLERITDFNKEKYIWNRK